MKFRTGFVSNSSSSSFVILGFVLDSNTSKHLEDIVRKKTNSAKTEEYWSCSNCGYIPNNRPKFCEHCGGEMVSKSRPKPLTKGEIANTLGLHYYSSPEHGPIVGLNISLLSVKEIAKRAEKLADIVGSDIELIALGGAGLEL